MKNWKKLIVLGLSAVLCLGLAACGNGGETNSPAPSGSAPADTAPADTEPADTTPADSTSTGDYGEFTTIEEGKLIGDQRLLPAL